MRSLVLVATLAFYGLCTSSAVSAEGAVSTDAPNIVAVIAVLNTTTTRPTTAKPNTTTTRRPTTAHVTNMTTTNHTTTMHAVTNTTTTNHTTTAHVTNTTTTNHTTTMHAVTTVLPTLSPNFSLPITGNYSVSTKNTICIKAAIGIQLIVKQKAKDMYFNIPPKETVTSGECGNVASWINLKFNSGFVNFTFVKDGNQYYINEISVALHSVNNLDGSYASTVKNMKLFKTTLGHAYKCKSRQVVAFPTDSLQIVVVDTLLQAFGVPGGKFGKVEECFMDYKIIVPIIFGVALFVLIIIIIILCLIYRHRRVAGYQRI
uniref:lysosome-associated membrane glycoprotein 3 isoform X2 n=1 Tax=Pristiophorus japonicus TaxID=55135 RepID=UPI00398F0036